MFCIGKSSTYDFICAYQIWASQGKSGLQGSEIFRRGEGAKVSSILLISNKLLSVAFSVFTQNPVPSEGPLSCVYERISANLIISQTQHKLTPQRKRREMSLMGVVTSKERSSWSRRNLTKRHGWASTRARDIFFELINACYDLQLQPLSLSQ
ncbi:hypothetical protein EDD18DRAFT_159582 [Armillaria luteobubalina]|uniref:Uncharacterized protein n=1 Tax=Armillaria luteobubalina TaxID=153913 RepID=A0AA39TQE1_9AGAR|nr:hypothetical protein EDD18DRAFT_159582 [Armillaria luteobubalina]